MNIKELKIKDRIKFYWKNNIYEGIITNTYNNGSWYLIREIDNVFHDWVYKDNIISKLEPLKIQYKEIPINQDSKFKKESAFKIDYCSTCKNPITFDEGKTAYVICDKCNNKPAPKTFKFDIKYVNFVEFNQPPIEAGVFPTIEFKIKGSTIKYYESNAELHTMDGETLTVEIKEKQ